MDGHTSQTPQPQQPKPEPSQQVDASMDGYFAATSTSSAAPTPPPDPEQWGRLSSRQRQQALLQLQRSHGNTAVQRLLQDTEYVQRTGVVQRSTGGGEGADTLKVDVPVNFELQRTFKRRLCDIELTAGLNGTIKGVITGFDVVPGKQTAGIKAPEQRRTGNRTSGGGETSDKTKSRIGGAASAKLFTLYEDKKPSANDVSDEVEKDIELDEVYVELVGGGARETETAKGGDSKTKVKGEIGVAVVFKGKVAGKAFEAKVAFKYEREKGKGPGGSAGVEIKVPYKFKKIEGEWEGLQMSAQGTVDVKGSIALKVKPEHMPAIAQEVAKLIAKGKVGIEAAVAVLTSPASFIAGGVLTVGVLAASIMASKDLPEVPEEARKLASKYANGFVKGAIGGGVTGSGSIEVGGSRAGMQLYNAAQAAAGEDWDRDEYILEANKKHAEIWGQAYSAFYNAAFKMAAQDFRDTYGDVAEVDRLEEATTDTATGRHGYRRGSAGWAYDAEHGGAPYPYTKHEAWLMDEYRNTGFYYHDGVDQELLGEYKALMKRIKAHNAKRDRMKAARNSESSTDW